MIQNAPALDEQQGRGRTEYIPSSAPLTQPEKEAEVKRIMERYTQAARKDQAFKDSAFRHWKQVSNVLPRDWPYFTHAFEPETQIAHREAIEGTMSALFGKDTFFDLEGTEDQDEIETEIMRELSGFVLRKKVGFKMSTFHQFMEAATYGNGIKRHYAKSTLRTIDPRRAALNLSPFGAMPQRAPAQPLFETWPAEHVVDRFDFYPAPTGATIQTMPYCFERITIPLDTVKALGPSWGYDMAEVNKLDGTFELDRQEGIASGPDDELFYDLVQRLRAVGFQIKSGGGIGDGALKYIELLVYSEAPPTGEGCAKMCVIGNRTAYLKSGPNPWQHGKKQYSEIKYWPRGSQYWQAKGLPELLETVQQSINVRSSQIGDIIELVRSPHTLVNHSAGVKDLSDLSPWPGGVTRLADHQGVFERVRPDVPQSLFASLDYQRAQAQRVGKTTDYRDGASSGSSFSKGTQTLGGLQMLMQQQNMSTSFSLLLAEETGITEAININAQLIQQLLTGRQKVKILGENQVLSRAGFMEYVMAYPEDIAGEWNFTAIGASKALQSGEQLASVFAWLDRVGQMPEAAARLKQVEIATGIAELAHIRVAKSWFRSDQEQMQYEEEQASKTVKNPTEREIISAKFAELPPDAQAAWLEERGLPSGNAMQRAALHAQVANAEAAPIFAGETPVVSEEAEV